MRRSSLQIDRRNLRARMPQFPADGLPRPFRTATPAILNDYLRQRAGQHQRDGIATIHVLIDDAQPSHILWYQYII